MVSRRKFIIGVAALGAAAYAFKPAVKNNRYSAYFESMAKSLKNAGIGSPILVLDKARLDANLQTIYEQVNQRMALRVVTKSLPCPNLLQKTMQAWQTNRQMIFNYPMLMSVAKDMPQTDILLGKPLDPNELMRFFENLPAQTQHNSFDSSRQIQWLVDQPETLKHYLSVAKSLQKTMRFNIEIDVGLHRGGVRTTDELKTMLDLIAQEPMAQFTGLMGYDPHVVKVPDILDNQSKAEQHAKHIYQNFYDVIKSHPANKLPINALTLNTAGSPTYRLHLDKHEIANELSIGSAVVKPSDFDSKLLEPLQAALFIATPILKVQPFSLPYGAQTISDIAKLTDPNMNQSVIIHGGEWMAKVISPDGVQPSALFGRSTNQKVMTAAKNFAYQPGDYIFFRPTQSETLMLQFGPIAIYENGQITDLWPVFPASA